jgi:hypothetical protein
MTDARQARKAIEWRHETVDSDPPCERLGFCLTTDLTGNGRDDIIVGGAGGAFPGKQYFWEGVQRGVPAFPGVRRRLGVGEMNLFWYENPGWKRHDMAFAPFLDVGGALGDISGNGRLDVVAGQGIHHHDVYWFEQPDDPRDEWRRHLVTDAFEKYHDVLVADVDGDGENEVVGLTQESTAVFYYDIPANPYRSPWPDECRHVIDDDVRVEGVSVADVDGDGAAEIVAGTYIYSFDDGEWTREQVATGWDDTRVAVADVDGDGEPEIVLSEGDSPHYGTHMGRVAWLDGPDWEPTFLAEDLFCPHTLQVGDVTGNGANDIYVAEMGLGENDDPVHLLFVNDGSGNFERQTIETGIETHEAKFADLTGDGTLDIAGKSYGPNHHVDVWYNEREN